MTDKPDWMQPRGEPWRALNETQLYENPWIRLTAHDAVAPTGAPAKYAVVRFANHATGALPIFDNGDTLLVGQHRFPLFDYSWEIPEGGAPAGEDPLEGAKRELREETGWEAKDWRPLIRFQLSNSVTDERGACFLATGLTEAQAAPDDTEEFQLKRLPFREALHLATSGAIHDLITVASLLRAYHMAIEGELPESLATAMLGGSGEGRIRL
jgi:8-oxo-dGTP pyrophosphatase MutT (NUDIX family)